MLPESFDQSFLSQLELLKIRNRRAFLGARQGLHLSKKRGGGIEFSDYRQYEPGDNPRDIDWNIYARNDRLYVKRFQEEQDLSILILLDASASMIMPREDKKWNRATEIALALAYIALMQQDKVTISALGNYLSPGCYGPRAIHRLGQALLELKPKKNIDFGFEVRKALSKVKYPGICIFISDFLFPSSQMPTIFNPMRAMNLDVVALHLLGAHDISPIPTGESALVVDSESGEEFMLNFSQHNASEYSNLLEEHILKLKDFCSSSGISYLPARADTALLDFLLTQLRKTGLIE